MKRNILPLLKFLRVCSRKLFVESIFKRLCPDKSTSVTEQSDSESSAAEVG